MSHFCYFLLQLLFESLKVFLFLKTILKECDKTKYVIIFIQILMINYLIRAHNAHINSPPVGISTHLLLL